ncbi:hypothetical protein BGZ99_003064 [Dissophora globulifera]|uniref:Peptidase M48 domain-containing protein n=1 Tax=Dissophora globulifera TaxID=979702 RepID=A0A9P6V0U6_9FUNG|nr:hypothetical protein BGZ99_003064 [Dissophora globulifera]
MSSAATRASSFFARIARHEVHPCRSSLMSAARLPIVSWSATTAAAFRVEFSSKSVLGARGFHVSRPGLRDRPPSSWGDMIPQPPRPSSSETGPLTKIILRPQYKRFGQSPPGGPGSSNRGRVPIWLDRRYQIMGGVITVGGGAYYVTHLETVPVTGRRRFMDVSPQQEEMMAKEAYKQVMAQFGNHIVPSNHPYTQYVKRVASRIIKAAGLGHLDWEFHVVQSEEKNAFVLPGGKVFVFTGILPIAKNEDGLATVLGHEIAHQLARHSAEKLSFAKLTMLFGVIIAVVFDPSWTMQRAIMEFGMMLPFSRKCETEADQIGLLLVAQACFDPREAVHMWTRMASQEKGPSLAFLNTHPASKDRIKKLEEWMPKAMDTYRSSDCETTNEWADLFNRSDLAQW